MATSTWTTAADGQWGAASNWTGGVPDASTADAIIDVAGSFTVSLGANNFVVDNLVLNDAGATLLVDGHLALAGTAKQLDLTAGTMRVTGTLAGGTVIVGGGIIGSSGGVLDAVTWQGLLDLAANSVTMNIVNGLTVLATGGGLPGTIDIGGGNLNFTDSETLDNAVVNIANGVLGINAFPATLTLGHQLVVNATGGQLGNSDRGLVNEGLINALSSNVTQFNGIVANVGSIVIGASARVLVNTPSFDNSGGNLTIGSGGTLEMGVATSLSALQAGVIANNGGLLRIDAGFDLGGGTLDVAPAGRFSNIRLQGTLSNGTVVPDGGTLTTSGAFFDNVTWRGLLDLASQPSSLNIINGLTVLTAGGGQPGTIDIGGGQLNFTDTETLDNVVVDIDSNGALSDNGFPATLTLGGHVVVNAVGNANFGNTDRELVNDGAINIIAGSGGRTQFDGNLVNAASIDIDASANVLMNTPNFDNTDGSITMGAGSMLEMAVATSLAVLQGGTITNDGGLLRIDAPLDLGGGTLDVAPSGRFSNVLLRGSLANGTVLPDGGTLTLAQGTVSNVTWRGVLDLASQAISLNVENGLTVVAGNGSQPGTIEIGNGNLNFTDTETLDNVVVNIAGGAISDNGFPATLTLGNQVFVNVTASAQFSGSQRSLVNDGTINVSGTQANFTEVSFDLTNAGNLAVTNDATLFTISAVNNAGLMEAGSGALLRLVGVSGSGVLQADPGGVVELQGGPGSDIFFNGNAATIRLDDPANYTGTLKGAFPTDVLVLPGVSATAASIAGGTMTVTLAGGGSLDLAVGDVSGSVTGETVSNSNGTATIGFACYLSGTRLLTAAGEVAVEALRVGDLMPTVLGRRLARVKWIGHRRVDCRRHPRPRDVLPVRVAAGIFGPGEPARDLYLSPDHAVLVDDVLVPVRHLLNGATIAQVPADAVMYWHVELDRHDAILAEGLAAESYLDTGNRAAFENGRAAVQLQPDFAYGVWEAMGCAPLICTGERLVAIRAALALEYHGHTTRKRSDPAAGL